MLTTRLTQQSHDAQFLTIAKPVLNFADKTNPLQDFAVIAKPLQDFTVTAKPNMDLWDVWYAV
jgi:hypothetical protein